ncbi:MAG TPA: ATP-binding protein [Pyrinomonadaceae bacterium]|nr:ATP-binding protein [Pyrinomonadaceae bacterium]
MPDGRKEDRGEDDGGRVVYSRLPSGAESGGEGPPGARRGGAAASLAQLGREEVAPTLPLLLISFLLLVGLVFTLGSLSVRELEELSEQTQQLQREQSNRVQFLMTLRGALAALDFEARDRGQRLARGGITNPFDTKLGNSRDEAERQLAAFSRRGDMQTDAGRDFAAAARAFVEGTRDPISYSQQTGYVLFRDAGLQLEKLIAEAGARQGQIDINRRQLYEQARQRIDSLRYLALVLAALIAAATTWEVQRRFRQVRRSLEESRRERLFSAQMLEGMVAAVAAIDGHDRIRSVNQSFSRLFPRALPGLSVYDDIAPPDSLKLFAAASSSRVERATYRGRWTLTPEGEEDERHFEVFSSPLDVDGEHGQILTLFDVTEAAHNEAELRRKDALAAVGQAAAQVAHEIKNPLGSIRLGVAMLRDMTAGEEAHSTIDLVERGIKHLNKLTLDVTQYSREKPLALSEVDLHELLDSSVELAAGNLREKRTPVERDYTNAPLRGQLDEDQLRQVFVNLLANAADASAEGLPVTVSTSLVERRTPRGAGSNGDGAGMLVPHARVTVADRGSGMDERTRARIFEPFFTTKRRGTGLGLAIVKKIVEQHGGTITVESAPGQGTRFHVELPLRQNQ